METRLLTSTLRWRRLSQSVRTQSAASVTANAATPATIIREIVNLVNSHNLTSEHRGGRVGAAEGIEVYSGGRREAKFEVLMQELHEALHQASQKAEALTEISLRDCGNPCPCQLSQQKREEQQKMLDDYKYGRELCFEKGSSDIFAR